MPLAGHSFACSVRLVAWTMVALLVFLAFQPLSANAQAPVPPPPDAQGPLTPAAQPTPHAEQALPPAPPADQVPSPVPMTLDQVAPPVMLAPAPPGQGVIQRIVVEGTQRIEPD